MISEVLISGVQYFAPTGGAAGRAEPRREGPGAAQGAPAAEEVLGDFRFLRIMSRFFNQCMV